MDELLYYGPNEVGFEQGMEELLYYDTDDGASISGNEDEVEPLDNEMANFLASKPSGLDVEIPGHIQSICDNLDIKVRGRKKKQPKEISDMFVDLDQALDELDQVIEAQDEDSSASNEGVIPTEVYDAMVAQEMLEDDDGDVIPTEVYDAMVAQEMLEDHDGDVIPTEVYDAIVAQEMLEDQPRSIKKRRVMADKEDEDDAQ
ncbi:hypothetical protein Tco_1282781 [Tanacetum coccineum]